MCVTRDMLEPERWQLILSQVRSRGVMRVSELIKKTGASPATLRRDVCKLAELGHIRRIHGAIEAIDPRFQAQLATRSFGLGRVSHADRKLQLAKAASELCADGESIILNAGSTIWFMAEFLRHRRMQIMTNSFPIAQELIANSGNRIVLPGGEIYREQGIILSPFDEDAIQHFTASKMFMSCHSISVKGIIEGDPLIARAEAKLLSRADRLIVVADSSKFELRGSMAVCQLSRVHTLITDDSAPPSMLDLIRAHGVNVIVVPLEQEEKSRSAA
jgi:DeoR family ulaG and ulaABCDEF operon transcriptional repressor